MPLMYKEKCADGAGSANCGLVRTHYRDVGPVLTLNDWTFAALRWSRRKIQLRYQQNVRRGMGDDHDPQVSPTEQIRRAPNETHDRRHGDAAEAPLEVDGSEDQGLHKDNGYGVQPALADETAEPVDQESTIEDFFGYRGCERKRQPHRQRRRQIAPDRVISRHVRRRQIKYGR